MASALLERPTEERSDEVEEPLNLWSNVDVISEVLPYLNAKELSKCRSVCSVWKDESLRTLKLMPTAGFLVDGTKSDTWDTDLHKLFTDMSPEERNSNLFQNARFIVSSSADEPCLEPIVCYRPFVLDYGWIMQHLDISVNKLSDMFHLFQYCGNLKTLELGLELCTESKNKYRSDDGSSEIPKRIIVDETDYSNSNTVMRNLYSLKLEYNVQWNYGAFFAKTTPNLTEFKCTDKSVNVRDESHVDGALRDPNHFAKQLKMMNTKQLKMLQFQLWDPNDVVHLLPPPEKPFHNVLTKELVDLNWSSLKWFDITCTNNNATESACRVVALEWMELVRKVASTLEHLEFPRFNYVFKSRDEFPHLPKVTKAVIPHTIVKTSDFFQKLPSLQSLKLGFTSVPELDEIPKIISYCNESGCQYEPFSGGFTKCFTKKCEEMWVEGGGWQPHQKLEFLELRIAYCNMIPDTLSQLFPKLRELHFTFMDEKYSCLGDVIRILKDHESLKKFRVEYYPDDEYENDMRTCLQVAYVLMGIPIQYFPELPKGLMRNWAKVNYEQFVSQPSLRDMSHLQSFAMDHGYDEPMEKLSMQQISSLLKQHCFSRMPRLEEMKMFGYDIDKDAHDACFDDYYSYSDYERTEQCFAKMAERLAAKCSSVDQ